MGWFRAFTPQGDSGFQAPPGKFNAASKKFRSFGFVNPNAYGMDLKRAVRLELTQPDGSYLWTGLAATAA